MAEIQPSGHKTAAVIGTGLLILLSIYFALQTFTGIDETFSREDLLAFSAVAVTATLIEILAIFLVAKLSGSRIVTYLLAGAFIVVNAYFLNLILSESFNRFGGPVKALVLAAAWFAVFTIIRMADESRGLRYAVFAVAGIVALSPLIVSFLTPTEVAQTGQATEFTASPNIRKVEFARKPNVYLIGLESAAPSAVLERYIGLEDAPLPAALASLGFRVIPNLFSEGEPTKISFNAFLSMDEQYFQSIKNGDSHLMQGIQPSPLLEIFAHNGYETNTLYRSSYFGTGKGDHVDNYAVDIPMSVCMMMDPAEKPLAFFGACKLRESSLFEDGTPRRSATAFLLSYIEEMKARERPQVIVAHISPPGHVSKHMKDNPEEIRAFRETYEQISRRAARNVGLIVSAIRDADPDAIVFMFGDHGILLSKVAKIEDDASFPIRDRYGVLGGIYPPDACESAINETLVKGYSTTPEIARRIVQCLAEGDDPFVSDYVHAPHLAEHLYE